MLTDILAPLAAELGIKLTSATERSFLVSAINRAAKEMHDLNDLRGCEREVVVQLNYADMQIAMPPDVAKIFGIRHFESKYPVELVDMQARYAEANWMNYDVGLYKWRLKGLSPLKRSIPDPTPLTFTLPLANGTNFNVIVVGGTVNSAKVTEVVNFLGTDLEKTTTNVFNKIDKIRRVGTVNFDLVVTDLDDNEIAVIANNQEESSYQIVNVMDINTTLWEDTVVEVLYKVKFVNVVNDEDSFVFGDQYDEAIYYLTMAKLLAKQQGQEDRMQLALANSQRIMTGITSNLESHTNKRVKFAENRIYNIFGRMTGSTKL